MSPTPDHWKDLKSRSPTLGPYTTKGDFQGALLGDLFVDPSGGLGLCRGF